jgi:hypothetical protein
MLVTSEACAVSFPSHPMTNKDRVATIN